MADKKLLAVEKYILAFRSGEHSAVRDVSPHLAADVVLSTGRDEIKGHKDVLARVTGIWPNTPVMARGAFSDPAPDGDKLKVVATFAGMGAAPAAVTLSFGFNAAGQINRVDQATTPQPAPEPTDKLPDFVKAMVNEALTNGTPMTVAYVDEEGRPSLSLRGSTCVFSDTQLAIWLRSAEGGLPNAIKKNNNISLLYRDQKSRSTLVFNGKAWISTDEETRNRVFELTPEVEQNHDPSRKGAALIIDLVRAVGGTGRGGLRFSKA